MDSGVIAFSADIPQLTRVAAISVASGGRRVSSWIPAAHSSSILARGASGSLGLRVLFRALSYLGKAIGALGPPGL